MKRKNYLLGFGLLVMFICTCANSAQALNASDCTNYTSNIAPTTNGTTTTVTTTHNIDAYNWSRYNLNPNETAFYQFTANGQTAVNYVNPGAEASMIRGAITGSSNYTGNVLIFNPNGMTITTGAKINNLNTFTASTNRYDGVSGNNVLFSQVSNPKALKVDDVSFNNVNNAHFIAPGIIFNANNANPRNEISFRAIGGGSYNVTNNTFSNEVAVTTPALETDRYIMDIGGSFKANKITVESKTNYAGNTDVIFSSNAEANAIVTDGKSTNGSVYLLAENQNASNKADAEIIVNGKISGNSADVSVQAKRIVLNGNIDASGANGGSVDIKSDYLDQYGKISANGIFGAGGNINIWTKGDYVATNEATVSATGLNKGGNISVQGDYQILTSAKYDASSSSGSGGTVKISAPLTKLYGTNINASGKTAGGEVYIGGPGKTKTSIVSSEMTIVNDGSTIDASSTNGKGGSVVIDSAGTTDAFGKINTKGYGLNGGKIELSGALGLQINTQNVAAGLGGTLILDPKNIYITNDAMGNIAYVKLFQMDSDRKTALGLSNQDNFGSAISLYNNLMAVGAENTGSAHAGAAYLFYFNKGTSYDNLTLFLKLADGVQVTGPDGSTLINLELKNNCYFGSGIAITDKLLAIGARGIGQNGCEAYLWDFDSSLTNVYNGLKLDGKIGLPGGSKDIGYGSSLALKEYTKTDKTKYNMLAVGAEGKDANFAGREYLYQFTYASPSDPYHGLNLNGTTLVTPTPTITLPGPNSANGDRFGSGSALSTIIKGGSTWGLLAVGAAGDTTTGGTGGLVHLYQFDIDSPTQANISKVKTISESNLSVTPASGDMFGSSVALMPIKNTVDGKDYELLAIGAQGVDVGFTNAGAVYLTHLDENYNIALDNTVRVTPSSTATGDQLGSGVALGQTTTGLGDYGLVAMGAEQNSTAAYPNSGAIYLDSFTPNTFYSNLTNNYKIDASSTVNGHASLKADDNFGCATALWKNLLAVGAKGDDTGGSNKGAVYLYGFDANTLYKNLTLYKKLADGRSVLDTNGTSTYTITLTAGDLYGSAVSLYENLLAVGAPGNTGAAYFYNFTPETPLSPPYTALTYQGKVFNINDNDHILGVISYAAGDNFGSAISLWNTLIAIGASGTNSGKGAVYLCDAKTPTQAKPFYGFALDKTLTASIGTGTADAFGSAVALYIGGGVNALAVGAPNAPESSKTQAGAAYLYTFTGDSTNPFTNVPLQKTIQSGTAAQYTLSDYDHFGSSIALNKAALAIGAPDTDTNGKIDSGGVYLYTILNNVYANATYNQKLVDGSHVLDYSASPVILTPLNLNAGEEFGSAVSIYDQYYFVIGAQHYSTKSPANAGAIYFMAIQGGLGAGYNFRDAASDTLYLSPAALEAWLATENVVLQANNDIIFMNSVAMTSDKNFTLTLQSGRDTIINQDVSVKLYNSNIDITTNENSYGTNLVVIGNRDGGAADFQMQSGSSLETTGTVKITMNQGYKTTEFTDHTESGNIALTSVKGGTITINNYGLDNLTGSNVIFEGPITADAGGLSANSDNASITQNAGTLITLNNSGKETLTTPKGDINLYGSTTGTGGTIDITAGNDVNIGKLAQLSPVSLITGNGILNITGENVNINANSIDTIPKATSIDAGTGAVNITANDNATTTTDSQLYMSAQTSITGGAITLTIKDDSPSTSIGTMTLNNVTGTSISAINNETTDGSNLVLNGIINATSPTGASTFKATAGSVKESSSASTITAQGTTSLYSGPNSDIELLSANDFVKQVMVHSGNDAKINDISGIIIGNSDITNDLIITAVGSITQENPSTIEVGKDTKLYTTSFVSLNQSTNDFCRDSGKNGQVYIGKSKTERAASGTIVDIDDLALGDIYVTGDLNLTAGGDITQCKTPVETEIIAGGITTLEAQSADTSTKYNITLANSGNDFGTVVITAGKSVTINDINSITIGNSNVFANATDDALKVTAGDSIATSGNIIGNGSGTVTLSATNDITLTNNLTTTAGNIALIAGRDVQIGPAGTPPLNIASNGGLINIDANHSVNISGDATHTTNISSSGKDITITANKSGPLTGAVINMTTYTTIDGGTSGNVALTLASAGPSNGAITVNNITGNNVTIKNQGTNTTGSDVIINGNITANGGTGLTVTTDKGNITQNSTSLISLNSTSPESLTATVGNINLYGSTLGTGGTIGITAGNDVTIGAIGQTSPVSIASTGGQINVDAGHSVNITAASSTNKTTISSVSGSTNGAINITANKSGSITGSVINMDPYTTIDGGTSGNVALTLASAGPTNGAITVNNITGNNVTIKNQGTNTTGSDVIINGNITANGGTGLTVTTDKGNITQNSTSSISLNSTSPESLTATVGNINLYGSTTGSGGTIGITAGNNVTIGTTSQGAPLNIASNNGVINIDAGKNVYIRGGSSGPTTISSVSGSNGANINITANKNPVSGVSELFMGLNTAINAGPGTVDLALNDDANPTTGQITINDVTGGSVYISNNETSAGSNIEINGNINATNSLGNLAIFAAKGDINQVSSAKSVKSAGTTTLAAGSGSNLYDITLESPLNDFTKEVFVNAGKVVKITDANNLIMGESKIGDSTIPTADSKLYLTTKGTGGITQSGILTVYGTTHLEAGDGTHANQNNINLTLQNLFYDQVYISEAYDASITDADNLAMGDVHVTHDLYLVAGGNITQCKDTKIITVGDAHFDAGGTIELNNPGNNFGNGNGQIYIGNSDTDRAGSTSIVTSGALALGDIYVTGDLALTSGGAITQCKDKVVMDSGTTTLKAQTLSPTTNYDITLANDGNDFGTVIIDAGLNVSLKDKNGIILGASTIGSPTALGSLSVTTVGDLTGGAITQSGLLTVNGPTTLVAGTSGTLYDITLDTFANDFTGAVSVSAGNNVKIKDANNLIMGTSTIGSPSNAGSLALTTVGDGINGAITQSGALTVYGTTTLVAGTSGTLYNITLDTFANDFTGAVSVSAGKDVKIKDANNLIMGPSTIGSSTTPGSLALTTVGDGTNGAITQSGVLTVNGTTTLMAGTSGTLYNITLDTFANDFTGAVSVSAGKDVKIKDANNLIMGPSTIGSPSTTGSLALTTVGDGTNGAITQSGALTVYGTTALAAGSGSNLYDITLNTPTNDFKGAVSVSAGKVVQISDANDLAMGTVLTGGNLTLKAGQVSGTGSISLADTTVNGDMELLAPNGNITQSPSGTGTGVSVTGTTKLTSGTGNTNKIELTNDKNNLQGAITIASAYDASITNNNSILMNTSTVSNNLTLTTLPTGAGITQVDGSYLQVWNDTHLNSIGEIKLANDNNDFCQNNSGQVYISSDLKRAAKASIKDVDDLIMGDTYVIGDLTLTVPNGSLSQCTSPTETKIVVGGNVILDVNGTIDLSNSGNKFGYNGDGQLYLGDSSNFADSANIVNSGALKLGNIYVSGALDLTATGDITQCGAPSGTEIIANGLTTLTAKSGSTYYNIILENTGNNFNTVEIAAANSAKIHDVNDITIGTSNVYANATDDALKVTAGQDIFTSGTITGNSSGTVTLSATRDTVVTNNISTTAGKIALEAGQDVKIGTDSQATPLSIASNGGLITVDAGRSVIIKAADSTNKTTISSVSGSTNGDITITANKSATGSVINMMPFTTIDGGTSGNVTLDLVSTGLNNGAITVNDITGNAVTIKNQGTNTSGSDVYLNGNITTNGGTGLTVTSDKGSITQAAGTLIKLNSSSPESLTATVGDVNIYGSTLGTGGAIGISAGNDVTIGAIGQTSPLSIASTGGQINVDAGRSVNITAASSTNKTTISSVSGSTNGAINITANKSGSLTDSVINMANYTSIDAGPKTVTIALNNDANTTTTGKITLNDVSGGSISVTNNKITANSDILLNGIINSTDTSASGRLTLSAANGTITQGGNSKVLVQNDTYLNTPTTVTLTNTTNNFCQNGSGQVYIGSTTTSVNTASLYDTDDLIMGNTYVSSALDLTSHGGDITQCGPTSIHSSGTTTLNAGGGDITLANSTNDFGGSVVFSNAGNVSIADANDLDIGASSNTGTFTASAGQDLLINGALDLGGATTLSANRSIEINKDIDVATGGFTATANNGAHAAGTLGNFAMAEGTTITVPQGDINITIPNNANAGSIALSNLFGKAITAWNKSLSAGTNVVINPRSTITSTATTPNPLVLCSDGGDFINNSGSTALSTAQGQRWLVYTGSPATTTLGGISPIVNTLFSSTIYTVPPTSVPAGNSVLYRTPGPGGGGTTGGIVAGGVTGAAAAGGALAASLSPLLLAGLTPNSVIAASPMYLLDLPEITGAAAPITGPAAPIYEGAKKYQFYYDKDKNIIIWVNPEEAPSLRK